MATTIDMKFMRYINLFARIAKVATTNCFVYNNAILFAVPKGMVSQAVGKKGENVKKLASILSKRVRVIPSPSGEEDMERFVRDVVSPATFNKISCDNGLVSISAGRESKAALIGRGRKRERELEKILQKLFNIKKVRIV
ncbi:MAG: hypothetical protein ACP5D2_04290 [Candidatus Nanoarchaeia archaeon]